MEEYEEVIVAGPAADVSTDNYEEFDLEINPDKLSDTLIQKNALKGTNRRFQFYARNNLLLNIIDKKGTPKKQYQINLAWLSAEPQHNKVIIWKWLIIAICCALISGATAYMATQEMLKLEYCYVIGSINTSLALVFTLFFIYCIRDEYIFKSYFGNAEIFLIENKKPNLHSFDSFYLKIQQTIDRAHNTISITDRLVGELKMCRRLRDAGIINDETYTRVRTVIFKHKEYKT